MNLSVGIITFNEKKRIKKTLEAVKDIADEIIIVDSGSTDGTKEIALKYTEFIYNEEWKGYGLQKNSVINKCKGEWILLIDADEVVSDELKIKIKEIIDQKDSKYDVYKINRCSICFNKEIKYGGWSNQYADRLFRKGKAKYNENSVHEQLIYDGKAGKIKEKIMHYSYLNLEDYLNKFNKYTTLGALDYYKKNKKINIFDLTLNPFFKFIRMYLIRGGFLDGVEGFVLAVFSSCYTLAKYFKLREIYKNKVYKK